MNERIRVLALAIVRRGDEVLVERGYDDVRREVFYRLPGGGIDFGETGAEAVVRELGEELGADAEVIRYVETVESIFEYRGEPGHEISRFYECRLVTASFYDTDEWDSAEVVGGQALLHRMSWVPVAEVARGRAILYPEGALG